jgi:hypothetical protein
LCNGKLIDNSSSSLILPLRSAFISALLLLVPYFAVKRQHLRCTLSLFCFLSTPLLSSSPPTLLYFSTGTIWTFSTKLQKKVHKVLASSKLFIKFAFIQQPMGPSCKKKPWHRPPRKKTSRFFGPFGPVFGRTRPTENSTQLLPNGWELLRRVCAMRVILLFACAGSKS